MKLSRRRFLQAGSATLLLPFLESDSDGSPENAELSSSVVKETG